MKDEFELTSMVYTSVLLVFFAIGMIGLTRRELFGRFKVIIIWMLILLLVVAGYSYWPHLQGTSLYASLVPGSAITHENGQLELKKANDGHFYLNAEVNGQNLRFMIDTGATDISLSKDDAHKIGIDITSLNYNKFYSTANGTVRGASVKISYLKVGSFEMQDFYASVNEGELSNSLLGMAFLSRFKSFSMQGDSLFLNIN